jgi:hypothetical protein
MEPIPKEIMKNSLCILVPMLQSPCIGTGYFLETEIKGTRMETNKVQKIKEVKTAILVLGLCKLSNNFVVKLYIVKT